MPGSRTAQIRQNEIPPQRRKRKIPEPKAKREVPPPEQHINGAKNSGNKVGSFPHRKKRRVNSPMATPQTQTSPTLPLSQPGSLPSLKQLRLDEYLHLPIPTPNDSN